MHKLPYSRIRHIMSITQKLLPDSVKVKYIDYPSANYWFLKIGDSRTLEIYKNTEDTDSQIIRWCLNEAGFNYPSLSMYDYCRLEGTLPAW